MYIHINIYKILYNLYNIYLLASIIHRVSAHLQTHFTNNFLAITIIPRQIRLKIASVLERKHRVISALGIYGAQ